MTLRIAGITVFMAMLTMGTAAGQAVPLYGTEGIVLRSSVSYDGLRGEPNPFDLEVVAQVVSPSGKRYSVPGFFDGDGEGGPAGRVFRVRVSPDEPGTWTWSVTGNVPGLHPQSGSFAVTGTLAGFFGKGPIGASPDRPRAFRQRAGGPVFLIGKFLDVAAPPPIQFSHTMFSEELSEADRQAMLERHLGMRLNKINVYLANRGDYSGVSTTPWVGTEASNDKRRFDLRRWRTYEEWIVRLRDAGVVAQLWFFADDSGSVACPMPTAGGSCATVWLASRGTPTRCSPWRWSGRRAGRPRRSRRAATSSSATIRGTGW